MVRGLQFLRTLTVILRIHLPVTPFTVGDGVRCIVARITVAMFPTGIGMPRTIIGLAICNTNMSPDSMDHHITENTATMQVRVVNCLIHRMTVSQIRSPKHNGGIDAEAQQPTLMTAHLDREEHPHLKVKVVGQEADPVKNPIPEMMLAIVERDTHRQDRQRDGTGTTPMLIETRDSKVGGRHCPSS